jgi:plasmid stabilization system protein ParE
VKFKIRINPVAIADVQEIKAYIAEDNPAAAERTGNDIYLKNKAKLFEAVTKTWRLSVFYGGETI